MRYKQITYWMSTFILCVIMLYSSALYFSRTSMVEGYFDHFSYPTYLVIPLAILKVLGVIMILWRRIKWLTEWAYAGMFFNLILATTAHYYAGDGIFGPSLLALVALFPSYFLGKYLRD